MASPNTGTVLVTGGAGYIGAHAVLALRDAGFDVLVLDDLSTGVRAAIPDDVALFEGSCGDRALLDRIFGDRPVRAVLHFAGSVVVPDSVRDPLGYYRNNTLNSHALLQAVVAHRVPAFIFSSTAAVYGTPESLPVTEEAPTRPINPYGASKLMTEQMLRDVGAAHDLRFVALRYFNVAGADPAGRVGQSTPAATHLIKVACQAALGARPHLTIFGDDFPTEDGTGVRDYIHVTDLIRAHVLALVHLLDGGASATLNCGYGHGFSVRQVVEAVGRAAGVRVPVEMGPRRPGDPAAIVAGAERIRSLLGWRPRHDDLDFICETALAWERRLHQRGAAGV